MTTIRVRWGALALMLGSALLCVACATPFDAERAAEFPTPAHGVVVCEHPIAAAVGKNVLEEGGNAADAAIATALALAVVHPTAGNLGGGGFAVWVAHDPEQKPLALDFREIAPRALTPKHFRDAAGAPVTTRSISSALGVGIPSSPAGLWALHARLATLPFARLIAPAIALAREGFQVDEQLARALVTKRSHLQREGAARTLFFPDGEALAEGELLIQPELALTLERFRDRGPAGFYTGPVAIALADAVAACGGVLDQRDLANYARRVREGDEPKWREPLRGWFRGLEIVTMPAPSSGGLVLLQVLSLLDGFPLDEEIASARVEAERMGRAIDLDAPGLSGRAVHWWIEAMRRAFADRAQHMGDPDFVDVPVDELLSPAWIAERRVSIGEFANPEVEPLDGPLITESDQTTHISVLDSQGNALSLTTTLNASFGCGILVPGAGFFLNNEMDDFAIFPGVANMYGLVGGNANALRAGKRPLSSMTPTIVREAGQVVRWVLGAPGGPRIISALIQVFLRSEVYGQSLVDAVGAPRLHQQWNPSATSFEDGWDEVLLNRLLGRRHEIERATKRLGRVQAIRVEVGGEPIGVSDPRAGGGVGAEGYPVQRNVAWPPVDEPVDESESLPDSD